MALSSSVDRTGPPYYQLAAVIVCFAVATAMIINTQFGGDAVWFWYAVVFHRGVHLYSALHIPLQPLFIMLTDAWMRIVGIRTIPMQIPSFVYVLVMCSSIALVLRSSPRPDWQKAVMLASAFVLTVGGDSYRFDDYHVVSESLIYFSIAVSLLVPTAKTARGALGYAAALGLICGLLITSRVTDGVGVFLVLLLILPGLLPQKRLAGWLLFTAVSAITVYVVILMTGDSVSAWASSTIFKAAASKGGTGTIFSSPFKVIPNDIEMLLQTSKRMVLLLLFIPLLAWISQRYTRIRLSYVILLLLVFSFLARVIVHAKGPVNGTVLIMIPFMYVPAILALLRGLVAWKRGDTSWDRRELVYCIPAIVWAAYAASAAAEPLMNYYSPMAMVLLLAFVMLGADRQKQWIAATILTVAVLIFVNDVRIKWSQPYGWQSYVYPAMFTNRQWFHHPVYGAMYLDSDLLRFSKAVCEDIGSHPGQNEPELLSLPYPYPNYFCVTPPWHDEVQTFFDTATRQMIEKLEGTLETAPPKYIVYQRQLQNLAGSERLYNKGQPIAQQDLDRLIMGKLDNGQWHLIEHRQYLRGDGWYIIQTHP